MAKILLVDDNEGIVEALTLILESEGFEVVSLVDGKLAHELTVAQQPDVVLLDILISGSDGRVICKTLKKDSKTKQIPVIMMSAHPDTVKAYSECGANDYIQKPFDIDKLITKINSHLSG